MAEKKRRRRVKRQQRQPKPRQMTKAEMLQWLLMRGTYGGGYGGGGSVYVNQKSAEIANLETEMRRELQKRDDTLKKVATQQDTIEDVIAKRLQIAPNPYLAHPTLETDVPETTTTQPPEVFVEEPRITRSQSVTITELHSNEEVIRNQLRKLYDIAYVPEARLAQVVRSVARAFVSERNKTKIPSVDDDFIEVVRRLPSNTDIKLKKP